MTSALNHRRADHAIESLLLRRWSPRAMSGEPISDEEMLTLFEAARWAPSTFNVAGPEGGRAPPGRDRT
jgi:nitroreductase